MGTLARIVSAAGAAGVAVALAVPSAGAAPAGRPADPLPPAARPAPPAPPGSSPWKALVNEPSFNAGTLLLLTDGRVLVQDMGASGNGTGNWWILTPSSAGSYIRGTWSQAASLPNGYAPLYFASAVLPDGKVIVEGGEYNNGVLDHTNQGDIYDPTTNTWTPVSPPGGWANIGDAPSTVLPDGQFMLGNSLTSQQAILDETTMQWTPTGTGKNDSNNEEGWTALPSGNTLTEDVSASPYTEQYNPSSGSWSASGNTPVSLVAGGEIGPSALSPGGTVYALGATGSSANFDTATGSWSAGPNLPVIGGQQYDVADGPGAILPDGNMLIDASPGEYQTPVHFFVDNGATITQVADAPGSSQASSFYGRMLILPTGQVLFSNGFGQLYVYTAGGKPEAAWRPVISSVPTSLSAGQTYTLSGSQLNGLTQDTAYGDDYQSATDYPLVAIQNMATKHIVFARTFAMSNRSIAPAATSTVQFAVPSGIGAGPSRLVVVANGIRSQVADVTVSAG